MQFFSKMTPQQNRIDIDVDSYQNVTTNVQQRMEEEYDEDEEEDTDHDKNSTLVALEAAEDFLAEMDDAFAEFDSRQKYSFLEVVEEGEEEDEMTTEEEEEHDNIIHDYDENDDNSVLLQEINDYNQEEGERTNNHKFETSNGISSMNASSNLCDISPSSKSSPTPQPNMLNQQHPPEVDEVIEVIEVMDKINLNLHANETANATNSCVQNNGTTHNHINTNHGTATATTTAANAASQHQDQGRTEVVADTNWGNDDFFGFTDDDDDDSEELLVSPLNENKNGMQQHNFNHYPNQNHHHHQNGIHHDSGMMKQTQEQEQELSSPYGVNKPLPQDQPQQSSSMEGNNDDNYNNYDSQNNQKQGQMNMNSNSISTSTLTSKPMETITTTQHTAEKDLSNYKTLHNSKSTERHETTTSSNRTDSSKKSSSSNNKKNQQNNNNNNNSSNDKNNNKNNNKNKNKPASCAKTLDFMYVTQSNNDELVQSHAEDVLSLTLELQNMKEKLKNEMQKHAETKRFFDLEEEKSVQFEISLQQLKADVRIMQEEHEKELEVQREDSESLRVKLEAAEEDAQQAFNLAKDSDEKIKEMEGLLQKSLDEVEHMRSQQEQYQQQVHDQLPKITEQYSQEHQRSEQDSSSDTSYTSYETPQRARRRSPSISSASPYRRDKGASIGMGRNILRSVASASVADSDDLSSAASASTFGSMTSNSSYIATLTQRTAERRRKLRESMNKGSDGGPTGKEVVCFSSPNNQNGFDLGSGFIKTVKSVTKIIKDSGKRLNLGGRRFNASNSAIKSKRRGHSDSDDLDIEALARNYCKSVEALISKKREEVKGLKQFCGFLEEKLK